MDNVEINFGLKKQSYNLHAGRNAFRLSGGRELARDIEGMDMDKLRRQQFVMRSFTDSIEMDTPPAAGFFFDCNLDHFDVIRRRSSEQSQTTSNKDNDCHVSELYDNDKNPFENNLEFELGECGMKDSSTMDTIIEVKNKLDAEPQIDEALGETQKYLMTVPGPGHVDQEIELHKSLLKNAAEESEIVAELSEINDFGTEKFDADLQRVAALAEAAEKALQDSGLAKNVLETVPSTSALRSEYSKVIASRPRPTTPTTKPTLDNFGSLDEYARSASSCSNSSSLQENIASNKSPAKFVPISQRLPPDSGAKIHVTIPSSAIHSTEKQRASTSSRHLSMEQPAWQTETAVDLLEVNPELARNAPPKPVVHRRSSVDWENFDEYHEQNVKLENTTLDYFQKEKLNNFKTTNESNEDPFTVTTISIADNCDLQWSNTPFNSNKIVQNTFENENNMEEGAEDNANLNKRIPIALDRFSHQTQTPPSSPAVANDAIEDTENLSENLARRFANAEDGADFQANPEFSELVSSHSTEALSALDSTKPITPVRNAPPLPPSPIGSFQFIGAEKNQIINENNYSDYGNYNQQTLQENNAEKQNPYNNYDKSTGYDNTYNYDSSATNNSNPLPYQDFYGGHYSYGTTLPTQHSYNNTDALVNDESYNAYNIGKTTTYGYDSSAENPESNSVTITAQTKNNGSDKETYDYNAANAYDASAYGASAYDDGANTYNQYNSANQNNTYDQYATNNQDNAYDQYGNANHDNVYNRSSTFSQDNACDQYGTVGQDMAYDQYGTASQDNAYDQYSTANQDNAYDQYSTAGQNNAYDQYGTVNQNSAYGGINESNTEYSLTDYSNYTTQQQYGDVTVTTGLYDEEYNTSEYAEPIPPPPMSFIQPILPPQRSRTPDPFSWEVQETAYAIHGAAIPPPRPPPMAPTPEPYSPFPVNNNNSTGIVESETPIKDENDGILSSKTKAETERDSSIALPKPPPPPRPSAPSPSRPLPPSKQVPKATNVEEEEDPWAKFKQMTENVSNVVKATSEQLKNLSEQSVADHIQDETYLATIGGSQGFQLNAGQKQMLLMQEEKKKAKAEKKRQKASKKPLSPTLDPRQEEEMERKAREIAKNIAATHAELADWKPFDEARKTLPDSSAEIKTSSASDTKQIENAHLSPKTPEPESAQFAVFCSEEAKAATAEKEEPNVSRTNWAGFENFDNDEQNKPTLPNSDSDFFGKATLEIAEKSAIDSTDDPFAPTNNSSLNNTYDPFDTRLTEDIIAETRKRIEYEHARQEAGQNLESFRSFGKVGVTLSLSRNSTPTEGGSPASSRPNFFEDDFQVEEGQYSHTPTPLYDEDDSVPLVDFLPPSENGWELMLRHPLKKKIMADRFWKPCYVRIQGNIILIFNNNKEAKPYQEILLQTSYSLSDTTLQAYDAYGKIHTVKLQHILYKERLGIRAGQISRLVEGHVTKYGLPLEHAAQSTVLGKFGSLNEAVILSFIHCIEDILFKCLAKRETSPIYKQDEIQVHCYDEYFANVDKDGCVSDQKARVRFFCLAFLSGSPYVEIGLNDRRRQGKEIVRRKDILPMYTERWIRFENIEFHNTVNKQAFENDQVITLQPPDGCFFEIMRFRIRPPKNREKPLTVKSIMKTAGSKIEIHIKVMAAAQQQRARGTLESTRTIPCEDIQIRFPIPEAWIYIFREERHWGVGSVHSKARRTGKVKNLRDRLMGTVQHTEQTLIEVAIGEAKYEHVYRSLVWRIPRLPEKHHDAYKTHSLKCRFDLSSFDLMPESFLPICNVEFTMPLATISNTVVRSISIEQHEDSDRVEKFVRYVAKCRYNFDINYIQCNDLDEEIAIAKLPASEAEESFTQKAPQQHISAFNPNDIKSQHAGYSIDSFVTENTEQNSHNECPPGNTFASTLNTTKGAVGAPSGGDSSSSDDDEKSKVPMIEINMQGYGY